MARRSGLLRRVVAFVTTGAGVILVSGCAAHVPSPAFRTGYDDGTRAYSQLLQQYAPISAARLEWLCYTTAYQKVQAMGNGYAVHWQEGWNRGCAGKQP